MSTVLVQPGGDAQAARVRTLVDGEFALTAQDFRAIADMLHADSGIALPAAKASLVYSRLGRRLRALGLTSFRDYCEVLASSEGAGERRHMLTALTTNVTRFFREPHHFDHLKNVVLPPLLERAWQGGRVRLWSAACSTGQEPYSIALTILSMMPDVGALDIKILATDIDTTVVEKARTGRYDEELIAAIPGGLAGRWLTRDSAGMWQVTEPLRRLVVFRELNLLGTWPMRGTFDVIMCRNVVIYFEEETQALVWKRFAPLVAPGGHLYIGHSERLTGEAARHFTSADITAYRKRDAAP